MDRGDQHCGQPSGPGLLLLLEDLEMMSDDESEVFGVTKMLIYISLHLSISDLKLTIHLKIRRTKPFTGRGEGGDGKGHAALPCPRR